MSKLSVARVKALKKPGLYGDGGTLYLQVAPGGSKSWIQRITIDGKRHDIGLGGFPLVTLRGARDIAFENRRLARSGGDPLAAKRRKKVPTFRQATELTYAVLRPSWKNRSHARGWIRTIEIYAFPILADMPVDRITRENVLRVLTPIWTTKQETARRVRQRMKTILAWAQAHGYVEHNAAGEGISGALPSMPKVKAHLRALPYREVGAALDTIEASRASIAAKACLRFVVLTAARSGEARNAHWSEIDLERRVWTVPAARMKAGNEHRVPLSAAAVEVLQDVKLIRDRSGLVFPSPMRPGKPLSDMSMTKLLRDTGIADRATVHGFRSSFRDWCAETGKPRELAEAALAHTVQGVEGAYFRSDLFDRRRRIMDQWAAFVAREDATVVQLHGEGR